MPVQIETITAADGKHGGAKMIFKLIHENNPQAKHRLELFQDGKGVWYPVLGIDLKSCNSTNLQTLRVDLAATLTELVDIIQSAECGQLKSVADMLK